ncbi:MAG: alpha/beta hydrolase [Gammaproteobacteria bacterium]|nr:alpha/beta hydrolase [Gammaproteobacteria bacterium]
MKEVTTILLVLAAIYLLMAAYLYVFQRKLIYYPVAHDTDFKAQETTFDNQGTLLHGWVLNPDQGKALIYFGGNSELLTHRSAYFEDVFSDYSVYLINYRGYGKSQGSPSESALFSDALAIHDRLQEQHRSITAYGRSLGSGVAVYLASQRSLEKLILLTPYDSIAAIGQRIYPMFPIRYLIKDRFDSAARAAGIRIPVMIASAELDREIPLSHTQALRERFQQASVVYQQIAGAAHNDIIDFPQYRTTIEKFIAKPSQRI